MDEYWSPVIWPTIRDWRVSRDYFFWLSQCFIHLFKIMFFAKILSTTLRPKPKYPYLHFSYTGRFSSTGCSCLCLISPASLINASKRVNAIWFTLAIFDYLNTAFRRHPIIEKSSSIRHDIGNMLSYRFLCVLLPTSVKNLKQIGTCRSE